MDRLKVEGFQEQIMLDHTKLRAFELADEVALLIYQVTAGFPREELYGSIVESIDRNCP